jgi:hypothetical protein
MEKVSMELKLPNSILKNTRYKNKNKDEIQ